MLATRWGWGGVVCGWPGAFQGGDIPAFPSARLLALLGAVELPEAEAKSVFFFDPFMAGDRVEHAHLFQEILKWNPHINCYLLNTGGVGQGGHHRKIALCDTLNILESILRGGLEDWETCEATGLMVPRAVRGIDSILLHPAKLFPGQEFEARQAALFAARRRTLESYEGLDRAIVNSIKK